MKRLKNLIILLGLAGVLVLGLLAWSALSRPGETEAVREIAAETVERPAAAVRISEVMASNDVLEAEDGEYYDWIELENPTDRAVDISGWGLSDREDRVKYVFPEGSIIPAHGFHLVQCAKTLDSEGLAYFGISVDGGDTVSLFAPDGYAEQSVAVPASAKGMSYCRGEDGAWALTLSPTPGTANVIVSPDSIAEAVQAAFGVRITELMCANRITLADGDGEYSDWIELYNGGDAACELGGWYLTDNADNPRKWEIPALTLAPGEYAVVFCSGKDRAGDELHTNFSLSRDGGVIALTTPLGQVHDSLEYEAMEKDMVYRCLEGECEYSYAATPGYPNTDEGLETFLGVTDVHGEIVINEIVPYNDGTYKDSRGMVYDWIELRNVSNHTINLADYCLTNDPENPELGRLPKYMLRPNAYCMVFCSDSIDNKDGVHAYVPFSIGFHGEYVYLFAPDGTLSDSVYVHDVPYGGSAGRLPDRPGFFVFEKSSPSRYNSNGYRFKSGTVTASVQQGIYNDVEPFMLELNGSGEIYYTTNGNDPTNNPKNSTLYTGPIEISKTTCIRARCYEDGHAAGDIVNFTYIVNENHTLPVVSLVTSTKNFRIVSTSGQRSVQADGEITLFNDDGIEFSVGCTFKQHGNSSRTVHKKKMFMVEFHNRFGGNLNYDVFGDGVITEFSSLLLRCETVGYMYIVRDSAAALIANAVTDTALALNNRYAIMYVNGQYYGLCPIREDYSKQYVASHTGSTPESCVVVRPPVRSSQPDGLYDIITSTISRNMALEENYAWACEHWDMVNIADWLLLEGYLNNTDVGGNVRYIYGDNTDGKWRLAFYDLDIALLNANPSFKEVVYGGDQINWIMQSLLRSPEFQKLVAERCVLMLENGLGDNIALKIITECAEEVAPEVDRDTVRWRPSTDWASGLRSTLSFFTDERIDKFIDAVSTLLKLTPEQKAEYFGKYMDN